MGEMVFQDNFSKIKSIPSKLVFGKYCTEAQFSICIPIYGVGKHLEETLLNIKYYQSHELIQTQIIISNNSGREEDDKIIVSLIEIIQFTLIQEELLVNLIISIDALI